MMRARYATRPRRPGFFAPVLVVAVAVLTIAPSIRPDDCDRNGVEDSVEIAADPAIDCDGDGRLDRCELEPVSIVLDAPLFWPTSDEIVALAAADLDADGRLDLVAIEPRTNRLHVLFGRPENRAGEASPFGGPKGADCAVEVLSGVDEPSDVVAVDLDLDGLLDLAVTNRRPGTVAVFRGRGDRTFDAPRTYLTAEAPASIHAADLDGDGRPDLVTVGPNERRISTLLQNPDGSFQIHRDTALAGQPLALALGDFDGDEWPDAIVALRVAQSLVVLSGVGDGSFVVGAALPTTSWPADIALADLDRDGLLDVAVAGFETASIVLHFGEGDGRFAAAVSVPLDEGPTLIRAADIDGDGAPDLVTSSCGSFLMHGGGGDRTFAAPRELVASSCLRDAVIVDLDGDDAVDVATAGPLGVSVAFSHAGTSPFTRGERMPSSIQALAVGDFDGDTFDDTAVLLESRTEVRVDLNDGAGASVEDVTYAVPGGNASLSARDLTADGVLDLVLLGEASLLVLPGNGDGTFASGTPRALAPAIAHAWLDADGDGIDDIARLIDSVGSGFQAIDVVRRGDDGDFASQRRTRVEGEWTALAAGDLDLDRIPDLVLIQERQPRLVLFAGLGTGDFRMMGTIDLPAIRHIRDTLLVDIDADGDLDVVLATADGLGISLGEGSGVFLDPVVLDADFEFTTVDAADLDRDGVPEILATGHGLGVYRGDRRGVPQAATYFLTGRGVRHPTVGRLDGDDRPDLFGAENAYAGSGPSRIVLVRNRTRAPDATDCDGNGRLDACDISLGTAVDLDQNGVPDACEPDCDRNGLPDALDISSGGVTDLDQNGIPDSCEPDCNGNGVPDAVDIASATSVDRDGDRVPDECQPDCNGNGTPDRLDIISATSADRDENDVPDDCQPDCDGNGTLDSFDLATHASFDRNHNDIPDVCDIATGASLDRDGNGIPDEVEDDCDGDGYPDRAAIRDGTAADANRNGVPDACDIAAGESSDVDLNGVPDRAQRDCDGNGLPDAHELARGEATDCDGDGLLDACEIEPSDLEFDGADFVELPRRLSALAIDDLDGDGDPDVVWRFGDRSGIGVALADGFGALRSAAEYAVPGAGEPILRDFDRDGVPDIVLTAASGANLVVLIGLGDGRFSDPVFHAFDPRGARAAFLAAADLDGNGTVDLIAAHRDQSVVRVFPGFGDGTVLPPFDIRLLEAADAVVIADIDADSRPDLVVAGPRWSDNRIYLADGAGGFVPGEPWDTGEVILVLQAFDANGDGHLDILAGSVTLGGLSVWLGRGDGSFDAARLLHRVLPVRLAIADIDRDGVAEIVSARDNHVYWERRIDDEPSLPGGEFEIGHRIDGLAVADFDCDGTLDVIVGDSLLGGLVVARGLGQAEFSTTRRVRTALAGGRPVAADFDGDGHVDLCVVRSSPDPVAIPILWGDGHGGFERGIDVVIPPWTSRVDVADVFGDSRPEILVAHDNGRTEATIIAVNATRRGSATTRVGVSQNQRHVVARDIDGDGDRDLLAAVSSGAMVIRQRDDGSFASPENVPGDPLEVLDAIDLDRDGDLDIVGLSTADSPTQINVFLGFGNGSFGRARRISTETDEVESMATLDVDRDGFPDLVAGSIAVGEIVVFLGDGAGAFSLAERIPSRGGWIEDLLVADWNRDGRLDVTAADSRGDASAIVILTGTRDGGLRAATSLAPGSRVRRIASGDIDGDGLPDLIGVDESTSSADLPGLLVFPNRTSIRSTDCDQNGVPDTCEALADCDADGLPDACELGVPTTLDRDRDGVPDDCAGRCLVPGDCDENGALEVSDAICLLGHLFLSVPERLPCGSGLRNDGGNIELLDFQGDGRVDLSDAVAELSFLFLGGPPHPLASAARPGMDCVVLRLCRER